MRTCVELDCGFYFVMDSVITLNDDNVLTDLIHWNKSVITTQLTQPGQVMYTVYLTLYCIMYTGFVNCDFTCSQAILNMSLHWLQLCK